MMNQVFLFYGENSYTLRQELQRRKDGFSEKYGKDALFLFNHQNRDLWVIKQILFWGGLFMDKKMLILEGVPQDTYQDNILWSDKIEAFFNEFQANQDYLSPELPIIFLSYKPDKRTKIYKWLQANVQLKEFPPYKEPQIKEFIRKKLKDFSVNEDLLSYILIKIGHDLYRLENELDKLILGCTYEKKITITQQEVDRYCFGMVEGDAFVIFDKLLQDPRAVVKILDEMETSGRNRNEILGLLYRGLRVYLMLLDCYHQNITDSKQIVAMTKLHPFVINKNLKNKELLLAHESSIKLLFKHLIELEYAIKTWEYADEYFWLSLKEQLLSSFH